MNILPKTKYRGRTAMMGTSQVTRTRTEMEKLHRNQKVKTKVIIIQYLLRSLLEPLDHTTMD